MSAAGIEGLPSYPISEEGSGRWKGHHLINLTDVLYLALCGFSSVCVVCNYVCATIECKSTTESFPRKIAVVHIRRLTLAASVFREQKQFAFLKIVEIQTSCLFRCNVV